MRLRRRELLASALGTVAAGLAGCGSSTDTGTERTETVTAAPLPQTPESREITTVVEFDGLGPVNLDVVPSGDVYIAMGLSGQVRRLPASRTRETGLTVEATELVATLDTGNGFLYALDSVGDTLYAALNTRQAATHGVWRVPLDDGTPTRVAPFDPGIRLRALVADSERGRVLVTHAQDGVVSTVRLDDGETTQWLRHQSLTADLRGPSGLAAANQRVYVSNNERARIVEVPVDDDGAAGAPTVVAEDAALLSGASGLAVDGSSLYAAVTNLNGVVRIDAGTIETLGSARDGIDLPTDVALAPEGDALFVANFGFEQMSGLTGDPSLMRVPL